MVLSEAIQWAKTAEEGDYLVYWDEDGFNSETDPDSRGGFDDAELAEIETVLRRRGLTLEADDIGLAARAEKGNK